jgi:hypothetical protein
VHRPIDGRAQSQRRIRGQQQRGMEERIHRRPARSRLAGWLSPDLDLEEAHNSGERLGPRTCPGSREPRVGLRLSVPLS